MVERMELQEVCLKETGAEPYEIKVVCGGLLGERVITTAMCPPVGLAYINKFALAVMFASPWYNRSYKPRYEVWRDGRKLWTRDGSEEFKREASNEASQARD